VIMKKVSLSPSGFRCYAPDLASPSARVRRANVRVRGEDLPAPRRDYGACGE